MQIKKLISTLLRLIVKIVYGEQRILWEKQYKRGLWNYLHDDYELARYTAVLDVLGSLNGHILEIGCGQGILQSRMPAGSYKLYTGIDISIHAIKSAAQGANRNTIYRRADMESFEPEFMYDVIIFNESLYYAKEPDKLLKRYSKYLKPNGKFITSIYMTEENVKLIELIEQVYQVKAKTITANNRGSWICHAFSYTDYS